MVFSFHMFFVIFVRRFFLFVTFLFRIIMFNFINEVLDCLMNEIVDGRICKLQFL